MSELVVSPEVLERRFREIGVRFELSDRRPWFGIAVGRDRGGERIVLTPGESSVQVIDADREQEQLLLLVKDRDGYGRRTTQQILCGRDERSLFAVRVPARFGAPVNKVAAAHQALKPAEIRAAEAGEGRRRGPRRRRRGPAFVRQGDWFFVPLPHLPPDLIGMRKRVRLGRGGGNAHVVDYLCGDEHQFNQFAGFFPRAVVARGFVRHREHRPIHLRCWHRVLPNAANSAPGGYND